ncbi:MAG TPA: hypothetical protein VMF66_14255 [Candidatus Acidoferrum sp.]|nr:hypothetical protein [Candidatus Acidoferrum sp.]
MGPGYDIFRELVNGEFIWMGCAEGLDDAKGQIVALISAKPGRYLVRCAVTGKIVADFGRNNVDEACA